MLSYNCLRRRCGSRVARENRHIGEITSPARFVAVVGTSEITLTREVDKAQSFVHDKTRSPWNRRDRWWFLNGADCHVHWSSGMYARGLRWFTRKLGGTRGGGGRVGGENLRDVLASRKRRAARACTCAVPAICTKFQHRLSPSSVFMPESTESELSSPARNDIMLH